MPVGYDKGVDDNTEPNSPGLEEETPRAIAEQTEAAPARTRVWDPQTGSWQDPGAVTSAPPRARESRPSSIGPALAGGVIGAALVLAALWLASGPLGLIGRSVVVERRVSPGAAASRPGADGSIVSLAAKARPSVVNIDVTGRQNSVFGTRRFSGTGSGVILRSDGYIVSNAHVVENATEVQVTLASGEQLPARVIGVDADTDIAVVKVNRTDLPPAVIGSSKDLKVGELTIAIGSPLGLQQTVTTGIVSALGRVVDRDNQPPLPDMIQTDAAITSGNSGGALMNGQGALIGINTAIAAGEVGAEGIAFAIPIDIAKAVADELIATGKATHPWMGISGGNIDAETAREFGTSEGALIAQIVSGGPADRAGLKRGDIVLKFDGQTIKSMDELIVAIRQHKVGQSVPIQVRRAGNNVDLQITLGEKPSS